MSYEHDCIKCKSKYTDEDSDPYLCGKCLNHKQSIAKEIDKKFAGRSTEPPMTPLQEYDQAEKVHGFMRTRL